MLKGKKARENDVGFEDSGVNDLCYRKVGVL